MMKVTFTASISSAYECRDESPSEQGNLRVLVPVHATTEDPSIDLWFMLSGKLPIKTCPQTSDSEPRRSFVAANMVQELFNNLSRLPDITTHGEFFVWLDQSALITQEPDSYPNSYSAAVLLPSLMAKLCQDTSDRRATESAFKMAKDYLLRQLQMPFCGSEEEIKKALAFVACCKQAEFDFFAAYKDYDELERLHEGVFQLLNQPESSRSTHGRLLERTIKAAHRLAYPVYWRQCPPSGISFQIG